MLYLIGGAGRSGKSSLCKKLLDRKAIPYFSVDFLMIGLEKGAPELGMSHKQETIVRAEKLLPIVDAMIENIMDTDTDYVLDGDILLPEFVTNQIQKFPGKIRACFLGYSEIKPEDKLKTIRSYHGKVSNDWLIHHSDEEVLSYFSMMIDFSRVVKEECRKFNLQYFDESNGFEKSNEDAYISLIS